jgi:glycine/D-amino acid oxidase-like deaminating enzyme/nitrite reductase/ring-hydroxylating ferredoxin subunit
MNKILSGKHESVWKIGLKEKKYSNFKTGLIFDVIIIGGGITGINCAYLLKKMGYKVAIIEKTKIGHGVTLNTTAKITYGHGLIYGHLLKKFGFKKAKQYANANNFAITKMEEVIKEEKIKCDFARKSFYMFAETDKSYNKLKDEFYSLRKIFLPVSFIEKIDLPMEVKAAIKYDNQAQFNPLKYITGLADKINGNGSCIFENVRATKIDEFRTMCKVSTDKGKIEGNYVIVASHFPFYDPAYYFARMYPSRSYAIGVTITDKFPEGMFMSIEEDGQTYRNFTNKRKEIVIVGGESHKLGTEDEIMHYKKLEENTKNKLSHKKTEYFWSTHDNITIDRVPYIGRISSKSNNIFVATGFGKWGMTTSMVSALIISDLIENGESRWQDVFNPSRFKPITSAKSFIKQNLDVAEKYIKGKTKFEKDYKTLPLNEGTIIEIKGKKYAIYKDKKGKIFSFSPHCTHMGCVLSWNSAEKSWDCPCHGSRFTPEGKVINGPSAQELKKTD